LYTTIESLRNFSAVNGWELTLEDINKLGVKFTSDMNGGMMGTSYLPDGDGTPFHDIVHVIGRTYFCHCMARGTIGIVLSHMSILQDAFDSDYDTIWVMEDDIQVIRDPHLISDLIDKLDAQVGKKNWDILFTDRDTKDQNGNYVPCLSYALRPNFTPKNPERFAERVDISPEFTKVGARYGAYSMIVRKSGVKKILKFIKKNQIFLPYDMDFYLPNDINLYSVRDDVVSTLQNAASDNGAENYNKNITTTQE
jgi:GR25 family glycosyltransferase involved in LPS biosynthesis